MTETRPGGTARMPLPRRAVLGAVLAATVVAGATALGVVGAIDAPFSEDFRFTRGTTFAPGEELRLRGHLGGLASEDRIRIRITGHTGTRGDAAANAALSSGRAEAARAVALDLGFPAARIDWTGGVGGADPLPRGPDEPEREWERRLSRVTVATRVAP